MLAPPANNHTALQCLFSLVSFFSSWRGYIRGDSGVNIVIKPPASPAQDVRRPPKKMFIYLVPSLIYLPPPVSLPDWLLLSWLTACLDVWLPLSLDSHWLLTHTLHELRQGWSGERQSGCSGVGKSALCEISPSLCCGGLLDESRGKYLAPSPPPDHWPSLLSCTHDFTYLDGVRAWIYLGLDTLLCTGWVGCMLIWRILQCMETSIGAVLACVHVCMCTCKCRSVRDEQEKVNTNVTDGIKQACASKVIKNLMHSHTGNKRAYRYIKQ